MASKFQNRLVGTVVLVALVVIVLPAILDGHKKHYQDDFAAIPLLPIPKDQQKLPVLPSADQPLSLPVQPPDGAGEGVNTADSSLALAETMRQAANQRQLADLPVAGVNQPALLPVTPAPATHASTPANRKNEAPQSGNTRYAAAAQTPYSVPATDSLPDGQDEILALLQHKANAAGQQAVPVRHQRDNDAPPAGRAYVVQLGALKNANKVNELVDKLRAAGYRVYTVPATPVPDKITRILVGPDTSKDKLTAALANLQRITGLSGVVKNYNVHE